MFVVNTNQSQVLNVNLSNEYTFDYFLFVLSGNGLESDKLFYATADFAKSPRCVSFTIVENTTEDVLNGTISLPNASDLYCRIYNTETETLSIPITDPIWRGLWRVKTYTTTENENEIDTIIKGYDPREN